MDASFAPSLRVWIAAARPHTLSAAVVPVLVGSAYCLAQGTFRTGVFVLTLLASLLVQVGANLTDEVSDHGSAAAHKYPAPHKVIARGLLSPAAVRRGALFTFGAATLIGLWLVWQAGWPLLLLCLGSLAVAYAYSGGPLPLGDLALGEVLVFFTMGPVMVEGTVFAQSSTWPARALWYSLPVAALVTAILVANNLRDVEEDRRNARRTLATLLGQPAMRALYALLLAAAFAAPPLAWSWGWGPGWLWLPWLTLPLAGLQGVRIFRGGDRDARHRALKGTAALHLLFGVLLSVGLLL